MTCYLGRLDIVQTLLDAGDDPSSGIVDAIHNRRTDIVNVLLASGATYNVNLGSEDEFSYNANLGSGEELCKAFEEGHLQLAKLMLDAGVDPLACRGKCMRRACRTGSQSALRFVHLTHFEELFRSFRHGADPDRCR